MNPPCAGRFGGEDAGVPAGFHSAGAETGEAGEGGSLRSDCSGSSCEPAAGDWLENSRVKSPGPRAGRASGAGAGLELPAEDSGCLLWNMRVNSPGPEEAGGAWTPEDGAEADGGDCAAGVLTELNIRVNAPGSEEDSEEGCGALAASTGAGAAGAVDGFGVGTWLKTWEAPCEDFGAFCSIEVSVCNMRVNSPAPDWAAGGAGGVAAAAEGGAADGGGSGISRGFSAEGVGALACFSSEASRSSSLAAGWAETCPKIPVALAESLAAEGSAPRISGLSFGFFEGSMRGYPGS